MDHRTDTNGEPSNVLGVFGLSARTREDRLEKEFSKYGKLESVSIIYDHKLGTSRRFGFVCFSRPADAQAALKALDGCEIDERNIRVDYSTTQRPHAPTPGRYFGESDRGSPSHYRRDFPPPPPPYPYRGDRYMYGYPPPGYPDYRDPYGFRPPPYHHDMYRPPPHDYRDPYGYRDGYREYERGRDRDRDRDRDRERSDRERERERERANDRDRDRERDRAQDRGERERAHSRERGRGGASRPNPAEGPSRSEPGGRPRLERGRSRSGSPAH